MKLLFGYVRTDKPELKVKEFETYKAVYCTLCRSLGRSYGILSRLTLSYDFTFLALLQLGMNDECVCFEQKRCAFNPLKKCSYCKDDTALKMPAAAAMIMLYYNIKDKIDDGRGFKKFGYMIIKPFFASARKKAAKSYPEIEEIVSDYIAQQNRLEKAECRELDRIADPTATALSRILSLCSKDEMQKRVLSRLGYCIGRYIYLLDAACDLSEDIKNGSYNVLKYEAGENEPKEYAKGRVEPQLYFCINEAGKAFELLELKRYRSILGNIIYLGLEATFKKELSK